MPSSKFEPDIWLCLIRKTYPGTIDLIIIIIIKSTPGTSIVLVVYLQLNSRMKESYVDKLVRDSPKTPSEKLRGNPCVRPDAFLTDTNAWKPMNLLSGREIDYDDISKSDNIEYCSSKVKVVHPILHLVATMVEIINSVVAMVAF